MLIFADIVAVLATAAATPLASAARSAPVPKAPSFFSLDSEIIRRSRELMLKSAFQAPAGKLDKKKHEYMYAAPLYSDVRDSCARHLVLFEEDDVMNEAATDEDYTSCSLHEVHLAASALLQRMMLMEATKSSAHHTVFGIDIDTTLLFSLLSFSVSGIASGLSFFYDK